MRYLLLMLISGILSANLYANRINKAGSGSEYGIQLADSALVITLIDSSRSLLYQEPEMALDLAIEAFMMAKEVKFISGEARALVAMGNVNVVRGNFAEAATDFKKGISIFREQGQRRRLASALLSLGNAHKTQSDYSNAIKYYLESLAICEELELKNGVSANLSNIGLVYNEMQEYEKAEQYYLQAVEINRETGNEHLLSVSYNNLGLLYTSLERPDVALSYHKKSLRLKEKEGNNAIGVAYSFNNIGKVYLKLGEQDSAETYIRQSMNINENRDPDLLAISNELMAEIYLQKGAYNTALEYAKESLQLAEKVGSLYGVQEVHRIMADIYERSGAYLEALNHTNAYMAVKDSLTGIEKTRQISGLQAKFELDKREREIEILELENTNRKITQVALISGLGLFVLIGLLIYRVQRQKIKQSAMKLENNRLKQKQLEKDLNFKNKKLTTQSLNLVQKNEMMMELREKVQDLKQEVSVKELNNISHIVDYSFNLDKDWEQFQMHFEEVHSGFYHILKERCPDMTPNDMKLCALAKLNLNIKEMAAILGISPDSVKTARYRLRKKLNLDTDQNLTQFMIELEKEAAVLV